MNDIIDKKIVEECKGYKNKKYRKNNHSLLLSVILIGVFSIIMLSIVVAGADSDNVLDEEREAGIFDSLREAVLNFVEFIKIGITGSAVSGEVVELTHCQKLDKIGATYILQNNVSWTDDNGIYDIDDKCFQIEKKNIVFDGNGKTIFSGDERNVNYGIWIKKKADDVIVKNVKIDGFGAGSSGIGILSDALRTDVEDVEIRNAANGVKFTRNKMYGEVSNVQVYDCTQDNGIWLSGADNVQVSNVLVENCKRGITFSSNANDNVIENTEIRNAREWGILINGAMNLFLKNVNIDELGETGVMIRGSSKVLNFEDMKIFGEGHEFIFNGDVDNVFVKGDISGWSYRILQKVGNLKIQNSDGRYAEFQGVGEQNIGNLEVSFEDGKIGFSFDDGEISSAEIGFNNILYEDFNILKDGVICENCEMLSYDNGRAIFRVYEEGEYSIITSLIEPILEICDDEIDNDFDGNVDLNDMDCVLCGNGVLDGEEQCDDGNIVNEDGCNLNCQIEIPECTIDELTGGCKIEEEIVDEIFACEGYPMTETCVDVIEEQECVYDISIQEGLGENDVRTTGLRKTGDCTIYDCRGLIVGSYERKVECVNNIDIEVLNCNQGGCISENLNNSDSDGDGIIDSGLNEDVDNDGVINSQDEDIDGDGIINPEDSDIDRDGIENSLDLDIDGDGFVNSNDSDLDGDGIVNENDVDIDGDEIINENDVDIDGESSGGDSGESSGGGGSGGAGGGGGFTTGFVISEKGGEVAAVIDGNSWGDDNELDVRFMQSVPEYPDSCYNNFKDEAEKEVDCGGNCKACKKERGAVLKEGVSLEFFSKVLIIISIIAALLLGIINLRRNLFYFGSKGDIRLLKGNRIVARIKSQYDIVKDINN